MRWDSESYRMGKGGDLALLSWAMSLILFKFCQSSSNVGWNVVQYQIFQTSLAKISLAKTVEIKAIIN